MNNANIDRLSDLPEALIHHILSSLDMKEVIQKSLLSKRWRYLWLSLPNLNFHENMWIDESERRVKYAEFEKFVDQVLLLHDGSDIKKLCLSCNECRTIHGIDRWITSAVKQHVQELHLKDVLLSPTSLAGHVKTMELVSVHFPFWSHEAIDNLDFPNVETLILKECKHGETPLIISAPQLKFLNVQNYSVYSKPCCKIKICAPNLTTIQLKGYLFEEYSMENLFAIVTAEIDVYLIEIYGETREVLNGCFNAILTGVRSVECLTISEHCFKFFPELPNGSKRLPISFHNLKHLKLTECRGYNYTCAVAKLLENFPNLETLILERTERTSDLIKKGGDREAQLSLQCVLFHLKVIEIQNFGGTKHEFQFLGFHLNNVIVLEHIILKVARTISEKEVNELVEFCMNLHMMSKASSKVTIRLMLKREGRFTIIFEGSSSSSKTPELEKY